MLAPPNRGSEVVDYVKDFFAYKWIHGPPGQELGTNPESSLNKLKPIDIEVGIIAGDKSLNPVFSALIPGPDDGRVSVERAKLEEMTDFLVISSTHTSITKNPAVLIQAAYFLEHGRFDQSQD
ncbi:MAG: alpha/beta hydrolase, partial [Deltaproteobacteria bacterium]|nr:alpha/beta hydrolase [Deltaproteobacteria bacterium]